METRQADVSAILQSRALENESMVTVSEQLGDIGGIALSGGKGNNHKA
jgi:hypothetical protein